MGNEVGDYKSGSGLPAGVAKLARHRLDVFEVTPSVCEHKAAATPRSRNVAVIAAQPRVKSNRVFKVWVEFARVFQVLVRKGHPVLGVLGDAGTGGGRWQRGGRRGAAVQHDAVCRRAAVAGNAAALGVGRALRARAGNAAAGFIKRMQIAGRKPRDDGNHAQASQHAHNDAKAGHSAASESPSE